MCNASNKLDKLGDMDTTRFSNILNKSEHLMNQASPLMDNMNTLVDKVANGNGIFQRLLFHKQSEEYLRR